MKKTIAIVAIVGGCATGANMDAGLATLVGQDLNFAMSKLGLPSGQMPIQGNTVYVWGSSQNVSIPTTQTVNHRGTIGLTNYSGTSTYQSSNNVNYNCTIRLVVSPQNQVVGYDWAGNIGGCYKWAQRLG